MHRVILATVLCHQVKQLGNRLRQGWGRGLLGERSQEAVSKKENLSWNACEKKKNIQKWECLSEESKQA